MGTFHSKLQELIHTKRLNPNMLERGYPLNPNIAMQKRFVNRKPGTTAVLTDEGVPP